jgi:hypothetical protein
VSADRTEVRLLSWNGRDTALTSLDPGTHVLTNAGHTYPPPDGTRSDDKAARFGPKFAASRPSGDPAASLAEAWAAWLPLAAGDGLATTEPGAIIVRRELPDGRVYGSTSETLVALAADGRVRYDFQPSPPDPATWYPVDLG